jgi:hypothetical protein
MNILNTLKKEDIQDFLSKGGLTHDALWFYHVSLEENIDIANKYNLAAIKTLSAIEVKRFMKMNNIEKRDIKSFEDLKHVIIGLLQLIIPVSIFNEMNFHSSENNQFQWKWNKRECFAYKGLNKVGLIDKYNCGPIYRLKCWFKTLGVRCSVKPKIDKCMMNTKGKCGGEIEIYSFK